MDNLLTPSTGPVQVTGEFGSKAKSSSVYTETFELHPERIRAVLATGGLLLGYRALRRQKRS